MAAMMRPIFVATLASLLAGHGSATLLASRQQALESAWGRELGKSSANPVTRVVTLLAKMKAQLDEEASKEAEMYDKMVCWCETSEKEKTKAIADAEAKDIELSSEIESRSARVGKLSVMIKKTKEEISENTKSLDTAASIREKEAAKFRKEEKEMVQASANLRNAVAVLSKHQGASMMQLGRSMLSGIRVLLRNAALKYEVLVASRAESRGEQPAALLALKTERRRVTSHAATGVDASLLGALDAHGPPVSDFPLKFAAQLVAQAAQPASHGKSFLQVAGENPSYASQSGGIYGVMRQMLDEFESELKTMRNDEERAQADFKALEATKTDEIETGKTKLDEMQTQDAANSKALSDAKEDLTATRKQRSEDVKFLADLKPTCNDLDAQWQKRSKTRAAETKAVAEAMAILTEDDARETMARSVSLLQERSRRAGRAAAAAAVLRSAAQAPEFDTDDLLDAWNGRQAPGGAALASLGAKSSPVAIAGPRSQLSTLAMAVQLDSFTKVKQMMDTMVAELKKQQADEVEFKANCQKELQNTEKEVSDKTKLKKDLEAKIDQLQSLLGRLGDDIAEAKSQISQTQEDVKKASQTREEENKEFQSVVADQRASQTILKKALRKLKDFYEKGIGKAVLAQRSSQTPPVQFNDYKSNTGSNSVIGLIEQIVEDSQKLESDAMAGEAKAQAEYESFVKDSNAIIKGLDDAVVSKSKAMAAAKEDTAEANSDLESASGELESLAQVDADLHGECDWLMKNFDIRQKARVQEMESIQKAKAILSGA